MTGIKQAPPPPRRAAGGGPGARRRAAAAAAAEQRRRHDRARSQPPQPPRRSPPPRLGLGDPGLPLPRRPRRRDDDPRRARSAARPAEERSRWCACCRSPRRWCSRSACWRCFSTSSTSCTCSASTRRFASTSPMSWGAWILVAIYPATLLYGLAGLDDAEVAAARRVARCACCGSGARRAGRAARAAPRRPGCAAPTPALGVGARRLHRHPARHPRRAGRCGARRCSGRCSSSRASPPAPRSFMLFPLSEAEHHALRRWDLAAIGLEVALLALFLLALATSGGAPASTPPRCCSRRPLHRAVLGLVIIAGLGVPCSSSRRGPPRPAADGGRPGPDPPRRSLALRWILVLAGQA